MARKNNAPNINLNLNVRGLPLSATLGINELSNNLRAAGKHVYRLGLGQSPFPVPKPVVDALKLNAHQKDYLPVRGLPELRRAVAEYYRRSQSLDYTESDILIGPGSKELMFLIQLVYYGDLVIPTPSWVSYAPQAHIIGRHVRWLKTQAENDWLLMPEELQNLCEQDSGRPRLLILNYPSNPTGRTYNNGELKELARIARKYKIILLSDEIYGELHFKGKHISIARYYPEGTIISGGLSKWCGAGGWRLGTFAFPAGLRWLQDAIAAVASETFTSTSAPIQYAAVTAFNGGMELEDYLWNCRKILAGLGSLMRNTMIKAGIKVARADGAFYLFPDFGQFKSQLKQRGIQNSSQLCTALLEKTGVAILPGSNFGRPEEELTARLAYVDFDGAKTLEAFRHIPPGATNGTEFYETYTPNLIGAVKQLIEWLKK